MIVDNSLNQKILLIGIDLSFNSTGISICKIQNIDGKYKPVTIKFHRVIFDEKITANGQQHKPKEIKNVNQVTYRMPTNIDVDDLLLTNKDKNDFEQTYTTIRAMICSKKINKIIAQVINEFQPSVVICTIENYIMPSFAGPNSLKNVSGLITLQGFVRAFLIRWKITYPDIKLLLHTPSPTQNKKFFTGDGKADKQKMIDTFLKYHDGNKLIPDISHCKSSGATKIDDVIDSYSLMIFGWALYLKN